MKYKLHKTEDGIVNESSIEADRLEALGDNVLRFYKDDQIILEMPNENVVVSICEGSVK